ncbi:DUF397 domain-containing protein [Nonomuraea sp. NPDC048901]|uniref:DUF397 domain-containing protein n=1 Tax=Nonomuraea sp. NPDC048901 TaxID=3155627 RepID=UPI0033FFC4BB
MAKKDVDLSQARWRTSSLSGTNGQCVAVAFVDGYVAVRHSKNAGGPSIIFTVDEWRAFTGGVRLGEFDQP